MGDVMSKSDVHSTSGPVSGPRTMHDPVQSTRPKVVTLCGSTKFKQEFLDAQMKLTLGGWIVISVGCFGHADKIELTPETKAMLDQLHLRKIDMSDAIFVINKNRYIGESTRREIEYASSRGKEVAYLESRDDAKHIEINYGPKFDWVRDMAAFHAIGGDVEKVKQLPLDKKVEFLRFRLGFLREELNETEMATSAEAAVDGLIDLIYVAVGTLQLMGVDVHRAWNVVHSANMTKVPGVNPNRPNPFGLPDYIKPDWWQPPSHKGNEGMLKEIFNLTHPGG